MYKYIGSYIPMHDVENKITGRTQYVGDMLLPNMLYGKLILSKKAHAKIKNIDLSLAKEVEGIVEIYTCLNTKSKKFNSFKWIKELDVREDEYLFNEIARFQGDRLGVIIGESQFAVDKALQMIKIEYEELPVIVDFREAIKNNVKIHEGGNVINVKTFQCGNLQDEFLNCDIVVETELETPKIHHSAMENHCVIADADSTGILTIYSPSQIGYQVQMLCADITESPLSKVRVIKSTMGGSFGGKGQPILEPVAAFAACKLKRPVKIVFSREESIIATRTRHKTFGKVKTGVTKDGKIIARDIDLTVDCGAYYTNSEAVAIAAGKKTFRLYKIGNQKYTSRCVYTNTAIGGAARGYGSPQIQAITEVNIDKVARKLNMDPIEFRMLNLVDPFDKDPLNGPELGNTQIKDCLLRGKELFQWEEKKSRLKEKGRFRTGIGLGCGTHGNGYYGAYPDFIELTAKMCDDGSILIKGSFHDQGCGTIVTMSQIAAETLNIDIKDVCIPESDTFASPYDTAGTQACRVTFTVGGGVKKLCEDLNNLIKDYASKIFEEPVENLELINKNIISKTGKRISYSELTIEVRKRYLKSLTINGTYEAVANPASNAVNFVELVVDTYTGRIVFKEIVAVYDVGQAINRKFVHGQIHGALQMSAGFSISEELTYNNKGELLNSCFSKYDVFNTTMMPEIKVDLIEKGEELGAYGAKSIGEVSAIALAPAVINAIYDAVGIEMDSLPATPEKVMKLINKGAQ